MQRVEYEHMGLDDIICKKRKKLSHHATSRMNLPKILSETESESEEMDQRRSAKKYRASTEAINDATIVEEMTKLRNENTQYKLMVDQLTTAALKRDEELERKQVLLESFKENSKLVAKLREMVECPVCLELPREGPVPVCPNGHVVCSPCLRRRRQIEGELITSCPSCR